MVKNLSLEVTLVALVMLTAVAVLARDRILEQTFVIEPGSGYEVRLYGDSPAGGNTRVELLSDSGDSAYRWRCVLQARYQYPHCGFEIRLTDNYARGFDLSDYQTLRLWLDYQGPTPTVRAYLRNFDPSYSVVGDDTTTKYNQVEFRADDENDYYEFNLDDFFVANWWLLEKNISPQMSHPQFDNVASFEIQTGSNHQLGEHNFTLHRLEMTGQRIAAEEWYLGIIICWAVIILLFLVYRVMLLNREVRSRRLRETELIQVNRLLDARGRRLEEMARTDALTGAFNRKGIESALREGLYEWRRARQPLSIVMMDVDHFKRINDQYGHAVGDEVLTSISSLVKEHIRETDMFARWGGEEFVLVCRNTSIAYARYTAEKLRRLMAEHTFDVGLKVTASFGVAALDEQMDIDQLFRAADQALYRAKHAGRNCVVSNEQSGER